MPTRSCRTSVLDDIGDPDAAPGSGPWARWMLGQAKLTRTDLDRDVTGLKALVEKLERHRAWELLGFDSLAAMCQTELDLDEPQVELIRTASGGQALGVVIGKRGRPKKGEGKGSNATFSGPIGRGSEYVRARLNRDAKSEPAKRAILDRVEAGEVSAHKAAIEAGYKKVPTPYEVAQKAAAKLTAADKRRLMKWLGGEVPQ